MPLLDHFRPPLSTRRHWHSFHNSWAVMIKSELNRILPAGYFAEANVQFGIEIDVAVQKEQSTQDIDSESGWQPPSPTITLPFEPTTDVVEISVFSDREGPILAGAIELVSPANKDRESHRRAFTTKCENYLNQGIGLIIVDIVTTPNAHLHNELMQRMEMGGGNFLNPLYAVGYQVSSNEQSALPDLALWQEPLSVGGVLPILPLWLKGGSCVPIDLNTTYERTVVDDRLLD